jgi:transposase-like protein
MEGIVKALQQQERVTTPQGETWSRIRYPNFRVSANPKAWRYVSDAGRLMTEDLRVALAKPDQGYFQTTLAVHIPGAVGGSRNVPLHHIVAYTFLGDPPGPLYTVDHIDRCAWNNRADNLRWADPQVQIENREFGQYCFRTADGVERTSIAALARTLGVGTAALSARVRHVHEDADIDIQGHRVTVVRATRKPMATRTPSTVTRFGGSERLGRPKRSDQALRMLLDGKSVDHISTTMGIARSTVLGYIGKAAREADEASRERLAARLGVSEIAKRQELRQAIQAFHELPPSSDYWDGYKTMVLSHLPRLQDDWMLVKVAFHTLGCDM